MEEALRFYADESNYKPVYSNLEPNAFGVSYSKRTDILTDEGSRARAVLELVVKG
jgi:hypothetical protein